MCVDTYCRQFNIKKDETTGQEHQQYLFHGTSPFEMYLCVDHSPSSFEGVFHSDSTARAM
eukprot:m.186965 g.186965  ORF g.186965 m.186965 type:complete len:60 (+) comp14767_c2_seq5:1429-1608(+)